MLQLLYLIGLFLSRLAFFDMLLYKCESIPIKQGLRQSTRQTPTNSESSINIPIKQGLRLGIERHDMDDTSSINIPTKQGLRHIQVIARHVAGNSSINIPTKQGLRHAQMFVH